MIGLVVSIAMTVGCADPNLSEARRCHEEKNYDQAIHYYKLVIEKDPENESARYGLVEAYALKLMEGSAQEVTPQRVEEAMKELRPLAEPLLADPNIKRYISMIYQVTAKRYAEIGRDDKVAEAWGEVTKIEPTFAEAYFNLGVALVKLGKPAEAIPNFEKSIELNPYFIKAYYGLGNSLVQVDRVEDGIKQYKRGLELNPDDPDLRHNLGMAYNMQGDKEKAIEELKKAIDIEPSYSLAYVALAGIYSDMGESEKAEEIKKQWSDYAESFRQPPEESAEEPVSTEETVSPKKSE
jgi:tetratricopeptide (TPR) repeat protein